MKERTQSAEKFEVVFLIWDGKNIQLEERIENDDKFQGFTIVPGGRVEGDETYKKAAKREIQEEYGITALELEDIGTVRDIEGDGVVNFRHIFLVTKWEGELSNPEGRNRHMEASFLGARELCKHPISQKILDLVEAELLGQNG